MAENVAGAGRSADGRRTTPVRCFSKARPPPQIFAEGDRQESGAHAPAGMEPGRGQAVPHERTGRPLRRAHPAGVDGHRRRSDADRVAGHAAVRQLCSGCEGVAPKPLSLVEKGVLKNFLLTRQPVRGFNGSNGRARLPGGYGASDGRLQQSVRAARAKPSRRRAEEKDDRRSASRATSPTGSSCARWTSLRRRRSTKLRRLLAGAASAAAVRCSHPAAGIQRLPGRPRGTGARPALPRFQRALVQGHPGRRRREQRVRIPGQRRSVGVDRVRLDRSRKLGDRALGV